MSAFYSSFSLYASVFTIYATDEIHTFISHQVQLQDSEYIGGEITKFNTVV